MRRTGILIAGRNTRRSINCPLIAEELAVCPPRLRFPSGRVDCGARARPSAFRSHRTALFRMRWILPQDPRVQHRASAA